MTKDEFLDIINKPYIKRVSILGGEPLCDENVQDVKSLLHEIRTTYPYKKIWVYTGYNFNSGKYGIVAIDGYHALSYFNPWCVEGKTFNFGVHGIACKQLKKIANNKTENSELKVYFSGRHVHFVGDDFILTQRIIEGNFVDFAQTVNMNDSDYTVTLNCAEFLKIAKEYAMLNKKTPIIHCVECSGKLATETHSSDFQTADCISIEDGKLSENLHIAFNAKYMADVKESKEISELYIREAFCS